MTSEDLRIRQSYYKEIEDLKAEIERLKEVPSKPYKIPKAWITYLDGTIHVCVAAVNKGRVKYISKIDDMSSQLQNMWRKALEGEDTSSVVGVCFDTWIPYVVEDCKRHGNYPQLLRCLHCMNTNKVMRLMTVNDLETTQTYIKLQKEKVDE